MTISKKKLWLNSHKDVSISRQRDILTMTCFSLFKGAFKLPDQIHIKLRAFQSSGTEEDRDEMTHGQGRSMTLRVDATMMMMFAT